MKFRYFFITLVMLLNLVGCHTTPSDNIANYFRTDNTITTDIEAAFYTNPQLQAIPIQVQTQEGVVQLSGYVKTIRQSDVAEDVARKVEGVKSVQNNLIVRK